MIEISFASFSQCENLKEITIPKSVTTIAGLAFMGCDNLVVYCEVEEIPSGWDIVWDSGVKEVILKGQKNNSK